MLYPNCSEAVIAINKENMMKNLTQEERDKLEKLLIGENLFGGRRESTEGYTVDLGLSKDKYEHWYFLQSSYSHDAVDYLHELRESREHKFIDFIAFDALGNRGEFYGQDVLKEMAMTNWIDNINEKEFELKKKIFQLNGAIETNLSVLQWNKEFIEWLESREEYFGGGLKDITEYEVEEDEEEENNTTAEYV